MDAAAIHSHGEDEPLASIADDGVTDNIDDDDNADASRISETNNNLADDDADGEVDDGDDHNDDDDESPPPTKRTKISSLTNDSIITIDDVSTMDASTYIAWVNQQAESLPDIFVASSVTATTATTTAESVAKSSTAATHTTMHTNHESNNSTNNTEIDSSSLLSTLQVFLSHRMDILPPPTARHLPPAPSTSSSQQNNLQALHSLHHALFAHEIGDDDNTDNNNETALQNYDSGPNQNNNLVHAWVTNIISNFSKLRIHLEKMSAIHHQQQQQQEGYLHRAISVPKMKDRMAWHIFCLGKDEAYGNIGGRYEYLFEDDAEEEDDGVTDDNGVSEDRDNNCNGVNEEEEVEESMEGEKIMLAVKEECDDTHTSSPPPLPPQSTSKDINPISSNSNPSSTQQPHPPTLPLLLQFDQVLTRSIFHHHVHYYCQYKLPLTKARASWIYAILARLEKPLHREECASVRSVLRECCERRWKLVLPSSSEDVVEGNEEECWEQLTLLNTLIAITGIYFEQAAAFAGSGSSSSTGKNGMDSLFSVS
ncbi:hypothetical protein ACHAWU_002162 [Discostella pseudostelligera]|uniref:Uncharacterized protein n=1 Tax=Discostella pseudostelligera TaxID=259834 RepID=A0ABD3MAL1_9STRA